VSDPLLVAKGLRTGFGPQVVLHGVDLDVAPAAVTGVFGLNGAGKTVLLKTLSGTIPLWSGTITLNGQRIEALQPERRVEMGMANVPQGRQVFRSLSIEQNLRVGGTVLRKRDKAAYAEALEEVYAIFPQLADKRRQAAGSLSGGQQAMLAVGRVLVARPRIVLIDEPSAGLSPAVVEELLEMLLAIRDRGMTMVVVEQNVGFGLRLADEALLLQRGSVIHKGPADDLDSNTLAAHLGVGRLLGPRPAASASRRRGRQDRTTSLRGASKQVRR
jgi:branched-chain amino acid transport system ATP-binding protein